MPPVYIREQGAVVRRRGERLLVTHDKNELLDLPLIHLDQLVLFGNVQLTTAAVAMLLQAEVDVVFLSQYGKFRGRLMHTGSKFAQLRHAQLQKMSDERTNLAVARQVVAGKLHNQRSLLQMRLAEATAVLPVQQAIALLGRAVKQAQQAGNLDSLRGYEGSGGAGYWTGFQHLLRVDLGFQGRKYFPPPDPVNAMLSFGYSLLLKDVTAAVQLVGLDPYLGFFHTINYARPSLALDMMEEFRPVVVDPVVLTLVTDQLGANHGLVQSYPENLPDTSRESLHLTATQEWATIIETNIAIQKQDPPGVDAPDGPLTLTLQRPGWWLLVIIE